VSAVVLVALSPPTPGGIASRQRQQQGNAGVSLSGTRVTLALNAVREK
jgi:hypothetical protein